MTANNEKAALRITDRSAAFYFREGREKDTLFPALGMEFGGRAAGNGISIDILLILKYAPDGAGNRFAGKTAFRQAGILWYYSAAFRAPA